MTSLTTSFEVRVAKETFKFNAAHFVAFQGFRERIHGHNYSVAVRLLGSKRIGSDGYVIDYGDIKTVTKKVCKDLNEHFICPTLSDVITISIEKNNQQEGESESVKLACEDGSIFVFPRKDCAMLPLVHATTEELAIYLWGKILEGLDATFLHKRGIHTMEITVAEAPGQEALFRYDIPKDGTLDVPLDVRKFIASGEIIPTPCLEASKSTKTCDGSCQASKEIFSANLQKIADAINQGLLEKKTGQVTAKDLEGLTTI